MITDEEVEDYYKKYYNNKKKGISLSICKDLQIDIKILCEKLSKKLPHKMNVSKLTRDLWTRFLLEHKHLT